MSAAPRLSLEQLIEFPYCLGCGCTESTACVTPSGPCHWVVLHRSGEYGICSACVDRPIDDLVETEHADMSIEISVRQKLACPKHPRYNPANGGEGAIRAGCEICSELLQLWKQANALSERMHDVARKITAARK